MKKIDSTDAFVSTAMPLKSIDGRIFGQGFWRRFFYRYVPRYLLIVFFNWAVNYYLINIRSVVSGSMAPIFRTGHFVGSCPWMSGSTFRPGVKEIQLLPLFGGQYTTVRLPDWAWLKPLTGSSGEIHIGDVIIFSELVPDTDLITWRKEDPNYKINRERRQQGRRVYGLTHIVKMVVAGPGDSIYYEKDGTWWIKRKGEADFQRYGNSPDGYTSYCIEVNPRETKESLQKRLPGKERHLELLEKTLEQADSPNKFFHIGLTKKEAQGVLEIIDEATLSTQEKPYLSIKRYRKAEPLTEVNEVNKKHPSYTHATKENPYIVPYKGFEVDLTNLENMRMYHDTIVHDDTPNKCVVANYANSSLKDVPTSLYDASGNRMLSYVFGNDFYYAGGANQANSADSRVMGPIRKETINCVLNPQATFSIAVTKLRKMPLLPSVLLFQLKIKDHPFLEPFVAPGFEPLAPLGEDPFDTQEVGHYRD